MKIAQVVCVYPPYRGGIGKIAEDYTKFLSSRGHEVTVFTTQQKNTFNDHKVKYLKSLLKLGNASVLLGLTKELKKYELVYLHYPFFGSSEIVYILKAIFKYNFKLVIHYHMDTSDFGIIKKIFSLPSLILRKKLFKQADVITCASLDYLKVSDIKDIYKRYPEKFRELPFSVDTEKYKPYEKNNEKKQITFVGGMDKAHSFKGVDVLIRSFKKLKKTNCELNLVGSGELVGSYKKLVRELNIEESVNFLEDIGDKELVKIYEKSDIFVLPSINKHEAFGIVLLEAMSAGVPVIASRLYGVRKVFEDGVQGLYTNVGDQDDITEKIETLLTSDKYESMASNARKLAVEKYSYNIAAERLNNIISYLDEDSHNK